MEIPVSTIRLSWDGKRIYSVARYYNEVYETDLVTGNTKSLGAMKNEQDIPDLFFDIISWKDDILLVPRHADNFYALNVNTNKCCRWSKKDLFPSIENESISFFSFIWNDCAYVMHRQTADVFRYDFEQQIWSVACLNHVGDLYNFSTFAFSGDEAIMLDNEKKIVFVYRAGAPNTEIIQLDEQLYSVGRVYMTRSNLYFYSDDMGVLFQCERNGEITAKYPVRFSVEKQSPALLVLEDELHLYASIGGEGICIQNGTMVPRKTEILLPKTTPFYWSDCKHGKLVGVGVSSSLVHDLTQCAWIDTDTQQAHDIPILFPEWDAHIHENRKFIAERRLLKKVMRENLKRFHMIGESKDLDLMNFIGYIAEDFSMDHGMECREHCGRAVYQSIGRIL